MNGPERMVEIFNDAGVAKDLLIEAQREPTDVVVIDPAGRAGLTGAAVHCGPVVAAPEARDLAALPPTLLISLSTYNFPGQTEAMQTLLDAAGVLPAHVIVTTGPVISRADLEVPDGVEVHDYLDHDAIMPRVTAVMSHGGHATAMRALAHGLPLAVMPMHPMLDQSMVGQAVQDAGAGRLLAREANPREIRAVLEDLITDGPHRSAAAWLARLIRQAAGPAAGAGRLEELLTRAPADA